ncbi:2-hydroxyacid dehydrogenase [Desulfoscipio gibsoniae]|uniref:Lactate dehydrogenase-like oxidoreductase n=1 Tax=Desulfoscipio gibsoniae DSM 7213 TaxID=767817 RepID=R4KEA7_9FIRM|nr:2-hydroxyacid dehydrogenase [Desulfoscipio gibsoniae]AGL00924.1 lactate dehydrogenase-like oxidoreductase [Desulfoscipio gibsoniae DSM 7213]
MPKIISLMPEIYFKDPGTLSILETFKDDLVFFTNYEPSQIIAAAKDATCLLCPAPYPLITEQIINALPNLKLIQSTGAGYDKIDIQAAARAGIPVSNTPGLNSISVAELVLAVIINLQRGLAYADRQIRKGLYQPVREKLLARGMSEITGSKWGVIGLGQIGSKVAKLGRTLGVEVNYFNRKRKVEIEKELQINYLNLEELLVTSDVVIVCLALTAETQKLIGFNEMKLMKPDSLLINVGRGGIIDETALAEALTLGEVGGAALDTFETEPLPSEHPFLNLPEEIQDRIFLTPHLGGVTTEALNRMLNCALANCVRVIKGEKPLAVVNGVE